MGPHFQKFKKKKKKNRVGKASEAGVNEYANSGTYFRRLEIVVEAKLSIKEVKWSFSWRAD